MPYEEVINYINSIKNYNIPLDKLKIIALSSKLISKCIEEFWKHVDNLKEDYLKINAEELCNIYLYIVYKLNLNSIFTEFDLIDNFAGDKAKSPIIAYNYYTIKGILSFILQSKKKEDLLENSN